MHTNDGQNLVLNFIATSTRHLVPLCYKTEHKLPLPCAIDGYFFNIIDMEMTQLNWPFEHSIQKIRFKYSLMCLTKTCLVFKVGWSNKHHQSSDELAYVSILGLVGLG